MGRRKFDWQKWDSLLGTMPDTKLANKIDVAISAVQARRQKLGIPPYGAAPNPEKWEYLDKLLGRVSDALLAEIAGCSKAYVAKRRRVKNLQSTPEVSEQIIQWFLNEIPEEAKKEGMATTISRIETIRNTHHGLDAFKGKKSKVAYPASWEKWDELLGRLPDKDLAEKIGCPVWVIKERRLSFGVPTYQTLKRKQNRQEFWSRHDHLVGTMSDNELAKILNMDRNTIRRRRHELELPAYKPDPGQREYDHLLGKLTDKAIAEKVGVETAAIKARRKQLGIRARYRVDWARWERFLGKMPDRELARRIGCDVQTVTNRRKKVMTARFE